ncbi:uncharacterized protein LOC115452739 [Manduca sexta]|uniref:uncharacterized protein LOC115452739 n=1 Tax=Manduca sexta TaxID=7130 RepID=UPI00188FBD02|nr:uncharacterized protein LOC115452739 [Manduca sexta]
MSVILVLYSFMSFTVLTASYNIYSRKKDGGNPYSSLLYDIVKKNENRVNDLKKTMQLQDYIVSRGHSLPGDDYERDDYDDEPYISGHKYGIRRFDGLTDESKLEDSRRNWMGPCVKKAARICRTACINAAKDVCTTYSCSSRVKRRFRKECRRNCNSEFEVNKYYSDYDSD